MGKSTPEPVNFEGAAVAEGEAARKLTEAQTWANRPTQVNPWGTIQYSNTPTWDPTTQQNINRWTQTQTLSPALQEALQYQMGLQSGRSQLGYGMMGNVAGDLGRPMDWSQFGSMKMPGQQPLMGNAGPNLWGNVQSDMPTYQTSGTLRNLNYGNAPGVMAPQFGVQRAEDALYNRANSRIQPQQQSELASMDIKLRNQGLVPGDQAYDSMMQNLAFKHNDQTQTAMNEAIMGGGREAERMFGMETGYRGMYTGEQDRAANFFNQAGQQEFNQQMQAGQQGFRDVLSAAELQNQARAQAMAEQQAMLGYNQNAQYKQADYYNQLRQQAVNEEIARRGYSLNEVNALLSGQQVGLPQFNQFSNAGVAQAPQLLQAAGMQAQQNAAQASAEGSFMNSLMGGAASLGAAGIMASDRRLKRNIRKLGIVRGNQWYEFDYVWGEHAIGVMADEVPHAALQHPSGYWMVDYSKV